ncbi:MAG: choice-of-anchor G family protein [Nocardioidaceae bacterium]|nr:choice-of-anchor G family protein [Nocardioidaceae bacterium]
MAMHPVQRRSLAKRMVASIGALAVVAAAVLPASAASAAPNDQSEALAQVVRSNLLSAAQLADVGTAQTASSGARDVDNEPLNAALLSALGLQVGNVQLPLVGSGTNGGLLRLGNAGVLNSYALSQGRTSTAAAGAITSDGGLSASRPFAPGDPRNATIDVTSLLGQLGTTVVTDQLVNQVRLEVGALASRASQTGSGAVDDSYRVAGARLQVRSPAVAALSANVRTSIAAADTAVEAAVGPTGALGQVVNGIRVPGVDILAGTVRLAPLAPTASASVDLSAVADTVLAQPLVSDNGLVSINLADGTISVDVAKLVKGPNGQDLNGLAANTSLFTEATIDALTDGVTDALGNLAPRVTEAVRTALNTTSLTVAIPVRLSLLSVIGSPVTANTTIRLTGTLAQFAGTGPAPAPVVTGGVTLGAITVPAGTILSALTAPVTTTVLPLLTAPVTTLLNATGDQLGTALATPINAVVSTLSPALEFVADNLLDVVINAQPTPGDLAADSFTVRALSVRLLPNVLTGPDLAQVDLASSTVRVAAAAAPTLSGAPDPVQQGGTVTATGTGFAPDTDVDLTYTDSAGNEVGTSTVTSGPTGGFTDPQPLPTGTALGALVISATDGTTTLTDTVQVQAGTPVGTPALVATPDPVQVGGTLTSNGTGFPINTPLTVTYTDSGGAVVATRPATSDGDGAFVDTLVVPAGTALGNLTVSATNGAGATAADTVVVQAADPLDDPVLNASPDEVPIGGTVDATGLGFAGTSPVTITYTDSGNTVVGTRTTTTDAAGAFNAPPFVVPVGTPLGDLTVSATDGAGGTAQDVVTVVAAPPVGPRTLTAAPDPVRVGQTLATTGGGFPTSSTVTVTYTDAGGQVVATSDDVPTDPAGGFVDSIVVPVGTDLGALSISAVAATGPPTTTSVVVEAAPAPAVPALNADPEEVSAGDTVTATGLGFAADSAITVTYTSGNGTVVGTGTTTSNGAGAFNAPAFVVPATTPLGNLVVRATDAANGTASDTILVVVGDPTGPLTLDASPSPVQVGQTVTSQGSGFPSLAPITVTYRNDVDAVIGTQTTTAAADGTFTDTFVVPAGTPVGDLVVQASAGGNLTATDTVQVEAIPVGADPAVNANPEQVSAGQDVNVTGTGFTAATSVTVTYTNSANTVIASRPITTDSDGGFNDTLLVPPGTPLGNLVVSVVEGTDPAVTDTVQVVVGDPVGTPALSSTPPEVSAGQTVTSVGTGFPAFSTVTVTSTGADAQAIGTPRTVLADEDGVFTDTFLVPAGTPTGDLTTSATAGPGVTAADTVQVVAGAPAADPVLNASPEQVSSGQVVNTTGTGFTPATPVTVTYTNAADVVVGTSVVTTGPAGGFNDAFTVPPGTPLGDLVVSAVEGTDPPVTDTVQVVLGDPLGTPALDSTPAQVSVGNTVTSEGTGYPALSTVTLTYTNQVGATIGTQTELTDATGAFTDTFVVPAGTPLGTLGISATAGPGVTAADSVQVVAPAPGAQPTVNADPEQVSGGQTVSTTGTGYPTNAAVIVTYTNDDDVVIGTQTVQTNAAGEFSASFVVPPGTPLGDLVVRAVSGAADDADTIQVVPAPAVGTPAVVATPGSVSVGDTVTATGTGYPASTVVTVTYDPTGPGVVTQTVTTDANGGFTNTFVVPAGTPVGPLEVTASAPGGFTDTDTVQVVAGDPNGAATVNASPEQVSAGQTVSATGTGYTPNTQLTVTFTNDADVVIGTQRPTTNAAGEFSTSLVVPPGTPLGDLDVRAVGGGDDATDTVQVVAAPPVGTPTVVATPGTVSVGQTVTAAGTGYPASTVVTVTYDGTGVAPVPHTVTTTPQGSFSDTFVVPVGTANGPLVVTATAPGGATDSDTVQVVAGAPVADPTVVASPDPVRGGQTVSATGTGYPVNTPVTVTFSDAGGNVITRTPTTNGTGAFTTSAVLPAGTPLGTLTVTAAAGGASDTDTVQVVAAPPVGTPSIDAAPGQVSVGDDVTVTGTGYPASTQVTVTYDPSGLAPVTQTVTTDANGSFTDTFVVPTGATPGPLVVTATAPGGVTDTDTVQVVAADPQAPPALNANPGQVSVGDTVSSTGTGFPPNTPVTVTYTSGGDPVGTSTGTTNADGQFDTTFVVPPGTPNGPLVVSATGGGTTATDTVTVVAGDPDAGPALTASPDPVRRGSTLTAALTGFEPDTPVTITYTDDDGVVRTTHQVVSDGAGNVRDTFAVPTGIPLGDLVVTAVGGGATLTDTVQVIARGGGGGGGNPGTTQPSLDASPNQVERGDTVTATGAGWAAGSTVRVTYTDANGRRIGTQDVTANASGGFTDTFVVPAGTPLGQLLVQATSGSTTLADSVSVVVDAGPPAQPGDPVLEAGPPEVNPGDTVTVGGDNYEPGTQVEVVYTDTDGNVVCRATVLVGSDGSFDDTCVIPVGTPSGDLEVVATGPGGETAADTVTVVEQAGGGQGGDGGTDEGTGNGGAGSNGNDGAVGAGQEGNGSNGNGADGNGNVDGNGILPGTGGASVWLLLGGLLALAAGGGVLFSRRRTTS